MEKNERHVTLEQKRDKVIIRTSIIGIRLTFYWPLLRL